MPYWVKIEDNAVSQCWDTPPPEGEEGWLDAVEIKPTIDSRRQNYASHFFDTTKNPVEIVWTVSDVSVESRQQNMIFENRAVFEKVVAEQLALEFNEDPNTIYSPTAVAKAKLAYREKDAAIRAATTHDELDAL